MQTVINYSYYLFYSLLIWASAAQVSHAQISGNESHHVQAIKAETTPCKGKCPVFTLDIQESRQAEYHGIQYNRQQGRFKGAISEKDYKKLLRLLDATRFVQLADSFTQKEAGMPTFILTVIYDNGKVKTINDYGMAGTTALQAFYGYIFSLTESIRWQ